MRAARLLPSVLAVAALVLVPAAWLLHDVRGRSLAMDEGSAENPAPDGALLARQYLDARARTRGWPRVGLLSGRVDHAPLPSDAVIFRLHPELSGFEALLREFDEFEEHARDEDDEDAGSDAELAPDEEPVDLPAAGFALRALAGDDATLRFVHGGGRLVVGVPQAYLGIALVNLGPDDRVERVFPGWQGVERLELPERRAFQPASLPGSHALIAAGAHPVISRFPLGQGEIIALSCPEILLNGAIADADHLALLHALAGDGRPTYFDESIHGASDPGGSMQLLRQAGLGPFVVLAALSALLVAWRRAVRVGVAEDPHRERRSEAVDFVDSVALVYERALGRRELLELHLRALEHDVALREGLRGERLRQRVTALAGMSSLSGSLTRHAMGEREFQHLLGRINAAFRSLDGARRRSTHHSRSRGQA